MTFQQGSSEVPASRAPARFERLSSKVPAMNVPMIQQSSKQGSKEVLASVWAFRSMHFAGPWLRD